MEKTSAENLIKPVVYEDFWSPFRKKGPKSIKKALRFSLKVEAVSRFIKTPKNR